MYKHSLVPLKTSQWARTEPPLIKDWMGNPYNCMNQQYQIMQLLL